MFPRTLSLDILRAHLSSSTVCLVLSSAGCWARGSMHGTHRAALNDSRWAGEAQRHNRNQFVMWLFFFQILESISPTPRVSSEPVPCANVTLSHLTLCMFGPSPYSSQCSWPLLLYSVPYFSCLKTSSLVSWDSQSLLLTLLPKLCGILPGCSYLVLASLLLCLSSLWDWRQPQGRSLLLKSILGSCTLFRSSISQCGLGSSGISIIQELVINAES